MENIDKRYTEKVLGLALDIGKNMIKCGAEVNRVEDTVVRICYAYGMKSAEVFSVVSMIFATVVDENDRTHTQTRRMYSYSSNFEKLERLNALSRRICAEKPDIDLARADFEKVAVRTKNVRPVYCFGYMLAASAFTYFFGGTLLDSLAVLPIAVIIYLVNAFIKVSGASKLFFTMLTSIITSALALWFVHIGFGYNPDKIMIGAIMLSIPGLLLINSVREMLCGDLMSGILRLAESIILAFSIACGFAIPIYISGLLGG